MKRLHGLGTLMVITIIGITAFQAYWIKQNYDREKKNLTEQANISFRESVRKLQGKNLRLEKIFADSMLPKESVSLVIDGQSHKPMGVRVGPREEFVTTISMLKEKLLDSMKNKKAFGTGYIISSNAKTFGYRTDTFNNPLPGLPNPRKNDFFKVLYDVDSLLDTLKVADISTAFSNSLKQQKSLVPFTVSRLDTCTDFSEAGPNKVTIGFAHPVTYEMNLGNTFPYLLKQISTPIIFSLFLIGITILSFALLYRSLLRQRKLAVVKNEFISNITHELKTPIATVGVAIEALKNFNAIQDPQRTREYLDISSNELQRLSLLVDKVLKLSMFEKKEIDLKYEHTNLKEIVDEVVNSMKLQIEKYHAKVWVNAEGSLELEGDKLHLQSVVFNLLDNALKYGKENPEVKISLQDKGDNLMMSMEDNGIGIAPEYHEKIFEKFFRIPHGDTHNAKGYGLGLSYVAHVIKRHKGDIAIDSRHGGGTKITITLPRNAT